MTKRSKLVRDEVDARLVSLCQAAGVFHVCAYQEEHAYLLGITEVDIARRLHRWRKMAALRVLTWSVGGELFVPQFVDEEDDVVGPLWVPSVRYEELVEAASMWDF